MNQQLVIGILTRYGIDARNYGDFLDSCPDNWFAPTNKENDAFSIASHLHELGVLAMRRTPLWNNGSYVGQKVEFKKID